MPYAENEDRVSLLVESVEGDVPAGAHREHQLS
jgi:hypothetical protein